MGCWVLGLGPACTIRLPCTIRLRVSQDRRHHLLCRLSRPYLSAGFKGVLVRLPQVPRKSCNGESTIDLSLHRAIQSERCSVSTVWARIAYIIFVFVGEHYLPYTGLLLKIPTALSCFTLHLRRDNSPAKHQVHA